MSSYREVVRAPGVARIVMAQLTARFPYGMLSIAFLLHIENQTGSYGSAGVVLAAVSVGQAFAGPLTSRFMGIWGMRRVLAITMTVCASAITAIALLHLEVWGYAVIAVIAGLSMPPVQSAVRTIYPKMVNSQQLTPLYSLDATAQEIIWVAGPVIATFTAAAVSPVAAILLAVLFLVGGGVWFISSPELGRVRIPRSKQNFGAVLRIRPVLLSTVIGLLLVGSFAAVEVGTVAVFDHGGFEAGIVLAIFSIGSIAGGLSFGHRPISPWTIARRSAIVTFGIALAALGMNFWWLSVTLFIAGIGIAPALAALFAIISSSVKFADTAEAYGWSGTGQLIGAALGSALAGFLVDGFGPQGGFVASLVFGFLTVAVAAIFVRSLPDLRGRDLSPHPDTASVPAAP